MLSQPPMAIEQIPKYSLDGAKCAFNQLVVGLADGVVEMWDLDIIDPVSPMCTLPNVHTDSVTSLHLNPNIIQVLASGSADKTVAIWDVEEKKNVHTYTFEHVVTQVQFNPCLTKKSMLCTLTEETWMHWVDCREEKVVKKVELGLFMGNNKCQAMCMCQSEFDENVCYIGLESGIVGKFDETAMKLET